MVTYEVNIDLDPTIEPQYRKWLSDHIREILQLEGFIDATVFSREAEAERVGLTVHYRLRDQDAIQLYLENHAARFRKDARDRFEGKFTATRRILIRLESISALG
jgi:hypothetical protein